VYIITDTRIVEFFFYFTITVAHYIQTNNSTIELKNLEFACIVATTVTNNKQQIK